MGPRVVLRPLTENDLHAVIPWCDEAQGLVDHLRENASDDTLGPLAITLRQDGRPIGVMEYRVAVPEDGWLGFRFVAVEPWLRGLGLDSEAVRLVEDDVLKRGLARRFWAGVHHNDGLALYFWLRLGYHPARPDEERWPGEPRHDTIVVMRVPAV